MRAWLLVLLGLLLSATVGIGFIYFQQINPSSVSPGKELAPPGAQAPRAEPSVSNPADFKANLNPDLTTDANGLSKVTAVIAINGETIQFKFYPKDAPKTVKRFIELINQGFYNGLTFHRVVPGFVIQGGDPLGNGMGGSGQKLDAEFNDRRHMEGAVAMARASDPNSADSQFYICLGTLPHLDHNYTVFGQVIEGMDVVRKVKVGDKITTLSLR
jgi:peptidylprolyl isomerase/peptidyl-prolyl cis-trans isomerase B (cyclophilin B)